MSFSTAIAIFIYKRPEKTRMVFDEIRKLKPTKLYVFANGPKNTDENEICLSTQKIFEEIDWPCSVFRHFEEVNIGLGNRLISGLNLLFELEEQAIILEDDCIPHPHFFTFCEELLLKYINDENIFHINGFNPAEKLVEELEVDYFASRFSIPSWGWATWRRAWLNFKDDRDKWQKNKKLLFTKFQQKNFKFWTDTFSGLQLSNDFWDLQWNIDIWRNNGLVLTSKYNLIRNLGNDDSASYMKNSVKVLTIINNDFNQAHIKHPANIRIFANENLFEDEICAYITHCFKS